MHIPKRIFHHISKNVQHAMYVILFQITNENRENNNSTHTLKELMDG